MLALHNFYNLPCTLYVRNILYVNVLKAKARTSAAPGFRLS
jgi:hypothetical protein